MLQDAESPAELDGDKSVPVSVFISYRKADASSAAARLYEHLVPVLGQANVFLDLAALQPGMDWRGTIRASARSAGVLLAVIGPHWVSTLHDRGQRSTVEHVEDVVRDEIALGLSNRLDVKVVPVLVDGANMPAGFDLPRPIQALADQQAVALRNESYTEDVAKLVDHLRRIAAEGAGEQAAAPPQPAAPQPIASSFPAQYRTVAETLLGRDQLCIVLGPGVNRGCAQAADAHNLALTLAREYSYPSSSSRVDLAEVAQYIYATRGEPDLYRALQEGLGGDCDIGEVHRFLAGVPQASERLGYRRQHQLVVTTNYDTLVEQAFREAGEPFDLAVYVASGINKGRFIHVPWQETPRVVSTPNLYHDFPFHDDLELRRNLIVKVHGAVDVRDADYGWSNNFVVTEDNYIEYLSGGAIEELVPVQILGRLRASHCLFLGYDIRDWSLRVFLKRVWGATIRARSWSVQEEPDELGEELWKQAGRINLIDESLEDYVRGLQACLEPKA